MKGTPRQKTVRRITVSLPPDLLRYIDKASQQDYLNLGEGYRRSISGFLQHVVSLHRKRAGERRHTK